MSVSVVVVGFGDEPVLLTCLESVRSQLRLGDDVVLVDHGIRDLPNLEGLRIVTPLDNGGFGAGCAAGVAATSGDVLVFVNSDAVLRPGTLAALEAAAKGPKVGLVGGLVVLADSPDTVNSVGLPVHLTGLSWCDAYGEPESRHREPKPLTSVAGALFGCRREVWDMLGGMEESYFMYHEDTDLSLRCHLAGLDVVYCPEAVATHAYDFSRNSSKMFYLERNRLVTVLGDYPTHLLVRVLPVLLLLEPLYLLIAARDGWAREKLRAWVWLGRNARRIAHRRKRVQASVLAPHALDGILTPAITQTQLEQPAAVSLLNHGLRYYWQLARPDPTTDMGRPTEAGGRPDVVVLRTNPKDSSLPRLLTILVERYRTTAVVWDRKRDYTCPVRSPWLTVHRSTRQGEYYRLSTVFTVALLQPWFLWSVLRARPRVVHAMDLDTGIVGLVAARMLRVPFVYQCLDPYAASLPKGWPRVIARLVETIEDSVVNAADLFVITDLLRLPQHERAEPRRLVELPNIPMVSVEPQPFSESGLVVGYIGSLVPHRALDVIVDTVGGMAGEGVTLVLGGFGPLEDNLRRQSSGFPNVTFLGWVDDDALMTTMGNFDVFVLIEDPSHPAYRWVSPNKVFESMALGRPLVVAEGTLAAERATEAGHGVTVAYGDKAGLRASLLALAHDVARRNALGEAGRAAHQRRWTPDLIREQVLSAYRIATDRPQSGGASMGRPDRVPEDRTKGTRE